MGGGGQSLPHLGDLPKNLWDVQAHIQELISQMQRVGGVGGWKNPWPKWGLQLPTGENEKSKMENGKTTSTPEESALNPDPGSRKIILPKNKILPLTL